MPCEDTMRISAPSADTRTESTSKGSDEKDSRDQDCPASLDLKSPSSVAANHAASLNVKSLTTILNMRIAAGFARSALEVLAVPSVTSPSRTHRPLFISQRISPPEAIAAYQPVGVEKSRRTDAGAEPDPSGTHVSPASSDTTTASEAFASTAPRRFGFSRSTTSDTTRR